MIDHQESVFVWCLMCFGSWSYTVLCTDAAMDVMQCYWLFFIDNIIVTFVIFVTHDRNDTIMGIRKLLQNTPQWLHHIKHILSALDNTTPSATIQHTHDPYPPTIRMQQLPDSSIGFVYMLVSNTHRNFAYVGETACIQRRLQQHSTGHGSNFTNNPQLRPWMCFVLVYRFPENGDHQANINARKSFEYQWHTLNAQDPLPNTHLHEWLNCLQPHASTLPWSNLGGLRTLSPINISSQCEYRHYPNIHFQHQNQEVRGCIPRMGNASSHHQNPSPTTVILQAQEHNTKLCATSKQFKTCTSTLKSLQHAFNKHCM